MTTISDVSRTPHILIALTGSVATVKAYELIDMLLSLIPGCRIKVIVSARALYFINTKQLAAKLNGSISNATHSKDIYTADGTLSNAYNVYTDADEWQSSSHHNSNSNSNSNEDAYCRGDPVLHIELRKWSDVLLIAPCSANTLAKLANGLCDTLITCTARAWDQQRPIVIAPAMNTHMYTHTITAKHMAAVVEAGIMAEATTAAATAAVSLQQQHSLAGISRVTIVSPITKLLACGDLGVGAMATVESIVNAVSLALAQQQQQQSTQQAANSAQ